MLAFPGGIFVGIQTPVVICIREQWIGSEREFNAIKGYLAKGTKRIASLTTRQANTDIFKNTGHAYAAAGSVFVMKCDAWQRE